MNENELKNILEAALLAADGPLSLEKMIALFPELERPSREQVSAVIDRLSIEYETRGIELKQVASGFRIQVKQSLEPWISRLWEERPPHYSRALLETLALIAYRQPITRAEIEDVRGVGVSSSIMKTLQEREWVRVVGYREVPGRPGMYATTREFLDYFNLKSLDDLPTLVELRDLDTMNAELDLGFPEGGARSSSEDESVPAEHTATAMVEDDVGGDIEFHALLH